MEVSDKEGAILSNKDPEVSISTMVVVKCPQKVEVLAEKIDDPLCGRVYKEKERYLVT